MNSVKVKRVEYVEIFIPTGNTKQVIYFPDLPNLRTAKTNFVSIYTADAQEKTLSGNSTMFYNEVKNTVVTLYFDGGDFIQIPAISLYNYALQHQTWNYPMEFAGQRVVWAKSYVTLTDTANLPNYANKSYLFAVGYEY
jgi:hypothetical protein